jgi:hypothetical protein
MTAAALGSRFEDVIDAMNLAERVSPVLAAGTKGNPRQIKRFLNALALRLAIAHERGFGDAIGQSHLAKIMPMNVDSIVMPVAMLVVLRAVFVVSCPYVSRDTPRSSLSLLCLRLKILPLE